MTLFPVYVKPVYGSCMTSHSCVFFCVADNTELHYHPRKKMFICYRVHYQEKLENISDKTAKSDQNTCFCRKKYFHA